MRFLPSFTLFIATLLSTQNCTEKDQKQQVSPVPASAEMPSIQLSDGFNEYWYAGVAELCTYEVSQERYGEIRKAEQVNVFVTEDFSKSKQVKLDDASAAGSDRVPVLKLNTIRRFHTGIYDYSIMQSIFTPVSGSHTLKTSTTVQDWCGQIFQQQNLESGGYHLRGFSYFETEGDTDLHLPLAMLEDEIWTKIRLNPWAIKTGKQTIIPSAIFTRLRHKPSTAQEAEIQIEKSETESVLTLNFIHIPRSLTIRFETAFPNKILGWEESYEDNTASKGDLKATRKSAYWGEHDNVHAPLRDSLKLQF